MKSQISKSFVNMGILFSHLQERSCFWMPGVRQKPPADWFSLVGPHCISLVIWWCSRPWAVGTELPQLCLLRQRLCQFSLLQRWYFVISKPTPFLIKCLFCPYCRVIIQDYGKLRLFGCLWTEKELQSQLWTVCCEKQKLRCMLTELRTSERGDANLGGALSVSFWIGFVLWYKDPERNQREFKSAPYFSSESLAVTFLTYINTDHKDLLSLEEKKKHWRNLWSQKESNNINFSCQVTSFNYIHPYWTILSPPLLAFPIISVSWLGEIPLLPTGTSSVYWSRPTYLFRR